MHGKNFLNKQQKQASKMAAGVAKVPSHLCGPARAFTLMRTGRLTVSSSRAITTSCRNERTAETFKNISSLPGPKIWPVLGDIEYLRNGPKNLHLTFANQERKYGAMFKSSLFGYFIVHVSDPGIAEEICRAEPKWPIFDLDLLFKELNDEATRLGYPAFLGKRQGEEWQELRRVYSKHMLQPMKIKKFYPTFNVVAQDLITCIRNKRNENKVIQEIRKDFIGKWSLEAMGMFVFGSRMGLLEDQISERAQRLHDTIEYSFKASAELSRTSWMKQIRRMEYKKFKNSVQDWFHDGLVHVQDVLDHLKHCQENNKPVDQHIGNSFVTHSLVNANLSLEQTLSNALEAYSASLHTTSATVSWLMYHLGRNLEKQEKLYEEVSAQVGGDGVTDDAAQKMPYLRACIKETQRLSNPAPVLVRKFQEDIAVGGYTIPAKTLIFINTHLMGRNEKYFADPNSFVPERWLRSSNAVKDINPFTTLPFGFGARSCVGRRVAEAEIQVLLALLAKNFKFEYIGEEQVGEMDWLLTPTKPMTFVMHDR